jgi:SAM-dependent methyltransferase
MNWRLKVGIQFVLSHVPFGVQLNHLLQKANSRYTPDRMKAHVLKNAQMLAHLSKFVCLERATIVEVGTGWELVSPLVMSLFAPQVIYTYDHIRHLRFGITRKILEQLRTETAMICSLCNLDRVSVEKRVESLLEARELSELLERAGIVYVAPGDAANTGLPDKSVDLFFSCDTFEHLPEPILLAIVRESRRLLKTGGIAYHSIEPGDHYTYVDPSVSRIHFLKYSDRVWGFWVDNKISYHNRLREKQFLDTFQAEGATLLDVRSKVDPADIALLQNGFKPNRRFLHFTTEELATNYTEVVYRFS